ncbi:MAG: DNA repair exonuclease [Planctomycetaceae bacterium]|nr:DNA repair exonuclease [Planctomycetaceae bacterium]MCB9954069.1 DNA repair exonuclease [Planctomycetaceae bacterium]
MFRFLHAADLHLDAPLKGLAEYPGAPVERLREATRAAFERLIQLAISRNVDFVVIAGDLFDGRWTNMQTGLWTANQFRLLQEQGIPVYLIRGNHDSLSAVPRTVSWPANVHEFPVDHPATFELPELGVAVHGQGFASRELREDVAADYPAAVPDAFNIGLLHTSLAGDARHDTYAPTSEQVLVNKGYQYWALGHIHLRQQIRETPTIAYSGCTQGRHINEPGAKGCLFVTVDGAQVTSEFEPLDSLRWLQLDIPLDECEQLDEVYDEVVACLTTARDDAEGRFLAVRLRLTGNTTCHAELSNSAKLEEIESEIRNRGNDVGQLWIERIQFETLPDINLEQLRTADDLMGELLRDLQHLQSTATDDELTELAAALAPLQSKAASELREAEVDMSAPDNIRRWLSDAEKLLLSQLLQRENAASE